MDLLIAFLLFLIACLLVIRVVKGHESKRLF